MQLSAKYQAILEILSEVLRDKYPADNILREYLRARKYIGAKDRRFISDTLWDIIRHRRRLSFDCGSENPRILLLTYLKDEDFDIIADGSPYGLAPLGKEEKLLLNHLNTAVYPLDVENECPQWLYQKINNPALCAALNGKASADVRVNLLSRQDVKEKLRKEGLFFRETPYSPYGLRSEERVNLQNCISYQNGEIEVQDESSQLGAILCEVKPHHKIIDYCCGGGGKSLMLGAILNNQGQISAHDKNPQRMKGLEERAARLGIKNIRKIPTLSATDKFDRFIIDAPCSGSGTWRRSPDAKYRLTPPQLDEIKTAQREILETAAAHISPHGRLIYMTCSVLPEENEEQITAFLQKHPQFEIINMRSLWEKLLEQPYPLAEEKWLKCSPLATASDGFFVCVLQAK